MAPRPTWIEVALNGPWGRALQPRIPVAVDQIIEEGLAAAAAGAAIVHFHAYDETSGRQRDDWRIYARVIEGIRARADVIVYPTIPLAGSGLGTDEPIAARDRYRHVDELGRRGLIEWAVVDPGTVNFARYDQIPEGDPGFVYLNPGEHIREGLRLALEHGIRPSYAVYEPGFARLGAALAGAYPRLATPVYRFMFSDEFAWGFPPRTYALEAHLALLREVAPAPPGWSPASASTSSRWWKRPSHAAATCASAWRTRGSGRTAPTFRSWRRRSGGCGRPGASRRRRTRSEGTSRPSMAAVRRPPAGLRGVGKKSHCRPPGRRVE
jgi:uncharacterized protein (DUF849 family)